MTRAEAQAWALCAVAANARAERETIDGEFDAVEEQAQARAALGEIAGELLARAGERACRKCGCTQDDACITDEGGCAWVEQDLCSACLPASAARPVRRRGARK